MDSFINIDGWRSSIRFSSAHVIPEYEKCGRLHGHSYAIHAKLYGEKDDKGIIADFSFIKQQLKNIACYLDHHILIPGKSPSIQVKEENDQITLNSLGKTYMFPTQDCIILPLTSTSAENLASYVLDEFLKSIQHTTNLSKVEIGIDEGYGQGAFISTTL